MKFDSPSNKNEYGGSSNNGTDLNGETIGDLVNERRPASGSFHDEHRPNIAPTNPNRFS
jgi:hypothetical protein